MSVYELWESIHTGETDKVLSLLKKKIDLRSKINEYVGFLTCLHLACIEGNVDACKSLLQNDAKSDLKAKVNGWTALHFTAKNDHLQCMKLLLDTNPKLVKVKNNKGQTAVYTAVCNDSVECLKLLLQYNCKVNTSDNIGKAPLHYAAQFGHIQCLEKLISEGADVGRKVSLDNPDTVVYSSDRDIGKTAYDLAVRNKQHTAAKLLKQKLEEIGHAAPKSRSSSEKKNLQKARKGEVLETHL